MKLSEASPLIHKIASKISTREGYERDIRRLEEANDTENYVSVRLVISVKGEEQTIHLEKGILPLIILSLQKRSDDLFKEMEELSTAFDPED